MTKWSAQEEIVHLLQYVRIRRQCFALRRELTCRGIDVDEIDAFAFAAAKLEKAPV